MTEPDQDYIPPSLSQLLLPAVAWPDPLTWLAREHKRVQRHLDRARKYDLPATLQLHEWLALLAEYGYRCVFCGERYNSIEHVEPLSAGGGTTAENVLPCCIDCNNARSHVWVRLRNLGREMRDLANAEPRLAADLVSRYAPRTAWRELLTLEV